MIQTNPATADQNNVPPITWQQDVTVDQDEIILEQILQHFAAGDRRELQATYGDQLASVFERALSQDGAAVRSLLENHVNVELMLELLEATGQEIDDQETVNALLDYGITLAQLLESGVPFWVVVASANHDERLFAGLLQPELHIRIGDLLLARADANKLVNHVNCFRPDTVRELLVHGVDLARLEACIDIVDQTNSIHGYTANYYRRQVQPLLDVAHERQRQRENLDSV